MICYFTFGQNHVHSVNGETFDKDSVVEIEGKDKSDCRNIMFNTFGSKWAFQYTEMPDEDLKKFYPRGIIKL